MTFRARAQTTEKLLYVAPLVAKYNVLSQAFVVVLVVLCIVVVCVHDGLHDLCVALGAVVRDVFHEERRHALDEVL